MTTMLDTLVKARRKEDGAEVIGYFYARVWNDRIFAHVREVEAKDGYFKTYAVDLNTVRRCVGIRDRNNELLFEGDIVSTKYGRKCIIIWKHTNCFVGWDLEPVDNCFTPPPTEWDLWYSENLERVSSNDK